MQPAARTRDEDHLLLCNQVLYQLHLHPKCSGYCCLHKLTGKSVYCVEEQPSEMSHLSFLKKLSS